MPKALNAKSKPTILVIIGITGDLSKRKLLPAIEQIIKAKAAPELFRVVGVTRRSVSAKEVLGDGSEPHYLSKYLEMYQMELTKQEDYQRLYEHLNGIEKGFGKRAQCLFYLSVPPQISQPIIAFLGKAGFADRDVKLLFEKPFGSDLVSAQELIKQTKKYFKEEQIYRIDHYLAKEMAQNMIVFREGNALFKRTWNKNFIESIEVIASEKIDIEGRTTFYEQTGALRDLVQSHLLQLTALTLMAVPEPGNLHEVPKLRLRALKHLHFPTGQLVGNYAKRGQYEGYRNEVGNPGSMVETYVDITLESRDPQWVGVPIRLITGKALKKKATEIRVTYKKEQDHESNELIIKLQPNEGVELGLWTKVPGYQWRLAHHALKLAFKDYFTALPEAYEQVLLDAMNSDHILFTSSEEVLETWRILSPLQQAWGMSDKDLELYERGREIKHLA